MRLVGDVGGTNSRLAMARAGEILPDTLRRYNNDDWTQFDDIAADFLSKTSETPREIVIAVAGPVHGDVATLTNRNWTLGTNALRCRFGVSSAHLLNDLTALGYAVPHLRSKDTVSLKQGAVEPSGIAQSLVVGIGTGFNVSPVLQIEGQTMCPIAEAGHVSLPHSIAIALEALGVAADSFPTVEHLFSGGGLSRFCQSSTGEMDLTGSTAIKRYGAQDANHVTIAINEFSKLLGLLLRELSLEYMPLSGIFFAGSVSRAVLATAPDPCLGAFLQPCSLSRSSFVPLSVITEDSAALLGCARIGTH